MKRFSFRPCWSGGYLEEMGRVLYSHQWESEEHWAKNVTRLADLTDTEISELVRLAIDGKVCGFPLCAAPAAPAEGARQSMIATARWLLSQMAAGLGLHASRICRAEATGKRMLEMKALGAKSS